MKINLPNPNHYLHREDQFFDQLELAIFHAKKAWGKVRAHYPAAGDPAAEHDYPWLSFDLKIDSGKIRELLDSEIDPESEDRQDIAIEINELT